jgi:hypothetical protein
MLSARSLFGSALVVGLMSGICPSAFAIVVENMTGTTSPPAGAGNDPGWNNVTVGGLGKQNFIYLGDAWALSARHVGPEPGAADQSLHFASGPIEIIPGQNYIVANPGGVPNPTPAQLTLESDLRLVRLKEEPLGVSSIFDQTPQFTIASQSVTSSTPASERQVTFIGHGRTRADNTTGWNSMWQESPPNPGPVVYTGYKANSPNDDTKRWGTNVIADENPLFGQGDPDWRVTFEDSSGRRTVTLVTQFNAPGSGGLTNEAQAVDKDSGSAVFRQRTSGQWELIGIVNFIYTELPDSNTALPNQPALAAVYGNLTAFADLTFYRNEIYNVINSHSNYSIVGDIDLDGQFETDLNDDIAAFVAGWGFDNGLGVGNVESWSQGDLSGPTGLRDGKTDVYDFIEFRNAINNPAAGASLAGLVGISFVPEPSAALLATFAAAWLMASRRRRKSSTI